MDPERRRELVKLILDAGLMEDFIKWLQLQGYTYLFGKLDNIPGELIETYVKEKKLLESEDEDREIIEEALTTPELEPPEKRNVIPAKRR